MFDEASYERRGEERVELDDENEARSASGADSEPVLGEGEPVGIWSEEEEDDDENAFDAAGADDDDEDDGMTLESEVDEDDVAYQASPRETSGRNRRGH